MNARGGGQVPDVQRSVRKVFMAQTVAKYVNVETVHYATVLKGHAIVRMAGKGDFVATSAMMDSMALIARCPVYARTTRNVIISTVLACVHQDGRVHFVTNLATQDSLDTSVQSPVVANTTVYVPTLMAAAFVLQVSPT